MSQVINIVGPVVCVIGLVAGIAFVIHQQSTGSAKLGSVLSQRIDADFPVYVKQRTLGGGNWSVWSSVIYRLTIREHVVQVAPGGSRYVAGQKGQWYFEPESLTMTIEKMIFGLPAGVPSPSFWIRSWFGLKTMDFITLDGVDTYRDSPVKLAVISSRGVRPLWDALVASGVAVEGGTPTQ